MSHFLSDNKIKYFQTTTGWIKIPLWIKYLDFDIANSYLVLKARVFIKIKHSYSQDFKLSGVKHLINKLESMLDPSKAGPAPELPHELQLRNYQQDGYKWLWWLYSSKHHGLLADDMGLGKTHQTLALISSIQQQEKTHKKSFL